MFKNIPSWLIKSRFKCKKQQHQKKTFCNLCFIVVFFFVIVEKKFPVTPFQCRASVILWIFPFHLCRFKKNGESGF